MTGLGVPQSMAMTRWLKAGPMVFVLGATLAGAELLAQKAPSPGEAPAPARPKSKHVYGAPVEVQVVKPGKLKVHLYEPGSVVPVQHTDVINKIAGSRTIISVLPEGTKVRNGEIVCELDATDLKTKLAALVDTGKGDTVAAAHLRTQIELCKIEAPRDGHIIHFNGPYRPGNDVPIRAGATARERQLLFQVLDLEGPMQMHVNVPESAVDRVAPGQPAKIRIDALQVLTGKVDSVAPLPNLNALFADGNKFYTVLVNFDSRPPWVRPGMMGKVEILGEVDDVLSLPLSALVYYEDRYHAAVKRSDGGIDWREVEVGTSGFERGRGNIVEIRKGIASGDSAVLNPAALIRPEERKEKRVFDTPLARRLFQ